MKINAFQESIKRSLERLQTEIGIAEAVLALYPQAKAESEIRAVKCLVGERLSSLNADNAASLVSQCEAMMPETAALLKSFTVHMVAHAHIDMNWMWGYDETVAVVLDTFSTVLRLMERYPVFTFSQSQASVYRIVERYDLEMLEEIRQRVREGRWEVSSSTWVEADKNMASGESQVRQVLYAKRYFKELFGLGYDDIKLDFEPDTFGHNLNVPAILSGAGVRYYYHCRAFDGPKLCRWRSPGGGSLICYFEKGSDWYNYEITPERMVSSIVSEARETGLKDILRVYGIGDHGGGPTVRDIENLLKMASWPVFPAIEFSTYAAYFKAAEAADGKLPVFFGERNSIFTGCYSSQSGIKKANRYGEKSLAEAEAFSALAYGMDKDFRYPGHNLSESWEKVLFSQFHDILPGSCRRETRHYALGGHQEVTAAAGVAVKSALTALSSRVDTRSVLLAAGLLPGSSGDTALGAGAGFWQAVKGASSSGTDDAGCRIFTVFNPFPFARSETVEAVLWDLPGEGRLVVNDGGGRVTDHQILEDEGRYWGHVYRRILFHAADIPPLGYKTFIVYRDPDMPEAVVERRPACLETPAQAVLENEHLRLELDTVSGAIKSLVLKKNDREMVPRGKLLGLFRVIDEGTALSRGDGGSIEDMTAWQVGAYSRIEPVDGIRFMDSLDLGATHVERSSFKTVNGSLQSGYVWTAKIRNSRLTTAVYLQKGSDMVHIDCRCDWLERGERGSFVPQLNIVFPLPVTKSVCLYEVPFGVMRRNAVDIDVPVLRWADISGTTNDGGRSMGLTVMTDSKYGYRAGDDFISISLIRSSWDPDPYPELGEHSFSMAIRPHTDECDISASSRLAQCFDQPLRVFQTTPSDGKLPAELSFIEITAVNVVMSALKREEDGDRLVARLYEIEGKETEFDLKIAPQLFGGEFTVVEADMLERESKSPTRSKNGSATVGIPAFGVLTLVIGV